MRFSTTVLVAVQASMGLAHAIPPPSTKYLDKIHQWIGEDHEKRGSLTESRKKFLKGYEVAKSTTRHTFLVPEDNEYESKKHHHDNEHGTTNHHPHDHESEDRYGMKNKYEPQRHHVSEKPHFKTHHPEKDYNHEEHYHHSESYDNPKTGHHHNDYNDETEYPGKEHEYKKDYLTEAFGPSDDHYRLNEHDFDKYFIKDHDASSKDHESDDIGDSQGSPFKRWTSKGDVMGQWWHPGQSKEYNRDPNKEHTHSYKYKVEPRLPDTTGSRKFKYNAKEIHDLNEAKEHHSHMFKPGYHPPEQYEAELEDQKYSHFNKHEQENDNLPYFDKYPEKYLPKQPFEEKRKSVPKAEYGGEDNTHHSSELKHDYAKEHYKKPNYEKEDEKKYGPESEEKYHKEEYSERKESKSKLKGFYDFNFGHNPEEGKFLDDESYTTKHGGSGEPEEIAFKKYYPKKSDKEDKEGDPNTARKYGYRKYHPKQHSSSHEEKKHGHKEEDKKHGYKKVYYPTQYEPKENTKFYRKQEVGDEDRDFKAKPHHVEHHTHYYDEPGYENVVPGFMWAGPGTVTKTPCASKEGCPYGHWHMLEPKDGEHRRIGITGTNIVVEPDYSRPDYKEDTVNHVLPGYEKVIPGFEWAGPGRVTEVPCPSVTDCPQGGWFMLAPRYGEHRRVAMNYPKATSTPHPHPHPHPQPHSTMHFHQPGYKPRSPVGYEGRPQDKDHDENEREYKLIHRHSSSMGKRSIEARTPCGKKKDAKKGAEEKKKLGPNKPVPRLPMTALLNFEGLSAERRAEIVGRFPWMDEELKKEFPTYKELTPRLITKLNEFWATLHQDLTANQLFIELMKRKPKFIDRKRATPELSEEEKPQLSEKAIKKIEGLSYSVRGIVAKKLDLDPKLTAELVKTDKLSDELIAKLNVEYARVKSDPKYNDILEKFFSSSKRSEIQLSEKAIKKIEGLSSTVRGIVAQKLDLDPKLTDELVKSDKLSDKLIEKLNVEYSRIKNDPKYKDILDKFLSNSKRAEPQLSGAMISKVQRMSPRMRGMAAEMLDMDPKLTKELVNAEKLTPELLKKLNREYARVQNDPKYASILRRLGSIYKRRGNGKDYFGCSELTEQQLDKILHMQKSERRLIAETLNFKKDLAEEFVNCEEFTPHLVKTLNEVYSQVKGGRKYNKLLEFFSDHENNHLADSNHGKRQLVPSTTDIPQTDRDPDWEVDLSPQFKYAQALTEQFIERFGEMIHDKVEGAKKQKKQQKATPSFNATKALDELIAGNSNETVSSQNATDLIAPQAISNLNTTELLEPQDAAGQNVTEIAADQPASNQTSTDGDLQDKLEQSKKNGWCNEFLGELKDTLKETAKAAQEEVAEAAQQKVTKAAEAA
ncbi:uncharacterized protein B0J16DRAFT_279365 [Fusarium flagelliforme]|uniref:uncharacterized protein n=1 Tax=Fusarium flagelliforme TaxID=2675880 RepID=UPI001E8CF669|nr:uncharacterized protein B0J16DRAFT_279365 [Fusarium flagelliforme]KAH7197908.1 hypothetical protein B0J16DRAFT_279365 [Fusarium flagelliforme]